MQGATCAKGEVRRIDEQKRIHDLCGEHKFTGVVYVVDAANLYWQGFFGASGPYAGHSKPIAFDCREQLTPEEHAD